MYNVLNKYLIVDCFPIDILIFFLKNLQLDEETQYQTAVEESFQVNI
jgi:hypothetical protein